MVMRYRCLGHGGNIYPIPCYLPAPNLQEEFTKYLIYQSRFFRIASKEKPHGKLYPTQVNNEEDDDSPGCPMKWPRGSWLWD